MDNEKYIKAVKSRGANIRLRTWTLTLAIIVSLIFYFLVTITTKKSINPIDFALMCVVQIVIYSIYFPDGDLFGQKDEVFISNKYAYNDKALSINANGKIGRLREYCKVEFEERKARYILNECGIIGISLGEYELLKQKSEKEIKHLKQWETNGKLIFFSKLKRHKLYKLLFAKLPIEENCPETIMSAVENDGNRAIKDGSVTFKAVSYTKKIFMAVVVGGIFSYIGYTLRDGIGLVQIISICMYLTTLFTTAVMSFTSGEKCSKVYKSNFYIALANFIDGFNEWDNKTK